MSNDQKLAKEIEEYQKLAQQDKKIDVASLMINALEKQQGNLLPDKQKRWAYLISLTLPPFGILFAVKFYFSGKDDGQEAGMICLVLTAVSILVTVLLGKALLAGTGANLNQLQQAPADLQDLIQ